MRFKSGNFRHTLLTAQVGCITIAAGIHRDFALVPLLLFSDVDDRSQ
jgi:hypothetical protein